MVDSVGMNFHVLYVVRILFKLKLRMQFTWDMTVHMYIPTLKVKALFCFKSSGSE
jgi:hypothetical protein